MQKVSACAAPASRDQQSILASSSSCSFPLSLSAVVVYNCLPAEVSLWNQYSWPRSQEYITACPVKHLSAIRTSFALQLRRVGFNIKSPLQLTKLLEGKVNP